MDEPIPVPKNTKELAVTLYDVRDAFSDKAQDDITDEGDRGAGLHARRRGFGKAKGDEQFELNVRLGNTNHSIESTNFDVLPKDSNGHCDTLILGADVVHPGVSSVEGTPSIAALVGSVDSSYDKYLGSMRMQKYDPSVKSTEVIDQQNMQAMARERLEAWKKVNNQYPGNIIYYRHGVSESQFEDVRSKEVQAIRDAYTDSVTGTPQAKTHLKITALVVENATTPASTPPPPRTKAAPETANPAP